MRTYGLLKEGMRLIEGARRQDLVRQLGEAAEHTRRVAPGFVRGFSGGLLVQESSPTLAFCLPPSITLHPDFFQRNRRDQMFILLHEVEHLKRDHAGLMFKLIDKRPAGCDAETWEQALAVGVDMEVNADLRNRLGYLAWGAACPGSYHFKAVPHLPNARAYATAVARNPEWVGIMRRFYAVCAPPTPDRSPSFPAGATGGKRPSLNFGNTVRVCRHRADIKRKRHDRMNRHLAGLAPKLATLLQRAYKENPKLMDVFQGPTHILPDATALASCSSGEVYVNPDLFQRRRRDQVFILLHEIAHLRRKHAALVEELGRCRPQDCDESLWAKAIATGVDLEINADLKKRLGYVARDALCPGHAPFQSLPKLANAAAYAHALVASPKLARITVTLRGCQDSPSFDPDERPAFPSRPRGTTPMDGKRTRMIGTWKCLAQAIFASFSTP